MAYDDVLAVRIRELLEHEPDITERKMFGGLAFLVNGNMAVAASGQGGILVRVDPNEYEQLIERTGAEPAEMRGREMRGWLRVPTGRLRTKRELASWVDRGVGYATSLPSK